MGQKQLRVEIAETIDAVPPDLLSYRLERAPEGDALIYSYDTKGGRTGITALLADIAKAGLTLRDLQTHQSSLEDIFVDLVAATETGDAA